MGVDKGILNALIEHKRKVQRPHFVFSCDNPKFPDNNELQLSHDQVLAGLQFAGYDAYSVNSHFGTPEKAIIIFDIGDEHINQLHNLASRLGQESSIYSDGNNHELTIHHGPDKGRLIRGQGITWYREKPQDQYVSLPGGLDHFSYILDMAKTEEVKKDIGQAYKEGARTHCDVLFKVKINHQSKLNEEIPLHMSVKIFNDIDECDIEKLKTLVKELKIKSPDPKKIEFKPTIFHSSHSDTDYYMLELKDIDDSYEKLYDYFKGLGLTYKRFIPHITINEEIYNKIKKDGLRPEDIEFGPLTVEDGANNTVHTFEETKRL
jgi:hypothetical protein